MNIESVIIGFIVGVALFEIYYGWKLRQERKILWTLHHASMVVNGKYEEYKEEEQMDVGKKE